MGITRVRWIATDTEEEGHLLRNKNCYVLRVRLPGEGGGTNTGAEAASEARQGDVRVTRRGEAPPLTSFQ